MMKILFIDTVHPVLQKLLEEEGHRCDDGTNLSREEILKKISAYDGIVIRSRISIDKEFFREASRLKFIARAGAGMENIDVAFAESKNIRCLNSPEGNRDAVGEHAIGMLLSLFNHLNKADREVRAGKWIREGNRGVELQGKTVGIMGYGNMGSSFAKKLSGFDCNVIAFDKYLEKFPDDYATKVSMEEIFEQADVLSLHVPLTTETEFLIDDDFINRFRKNIYIINTARGKCLKTGDLVKNLKSGKVTGACLDVNEFEDSTFENSVVPEEQSGGNPAMEYLLQSDKVILSPHIAGWTIESNEKIARVLYEKIKLIAE